MPAHPVNARIDLHNGLKDLATGQDGKLPGPPAELRTGTAVEDCDCENGVLKLPDGSELQADLIIGADGMYVIPSVP
jgi:2-polyprenyl-6-methoxyphenol hydroxylase-like FAD-dependent oxidoreductase